MDDDYRNTLYCPKLTDLSSKKDFVKNAILKEHPCTKDMHRYISNNSKPFKKDFVKAYNGKCAYCGVSIDIISLDKFEIDHIIPKKAERFEKSKANAGYIENLALSCYTYIA